MRLAEPRFDLDLAAIEAAITEDPARHRQHAAQPHRPHLRPRALNALADLLDRASARIGRRIFLLSDEPYRRLRFDGRDFVSPAAVYPWTLISYSYGKILLAPGQRLGYLAFSPLMPAAERKALRDATFAAQMALGWNFASALMQHAIPALEDLSIDQAALTRRRDRLMAALSSAGYAPLMPEGTFYLFSRWPDGDPDPLESAGGPRHLRHAGLDPRRAGPFPRLAHRVRCNGRQGDPAFAEAREPPRFRAR